MRNRDLILNPYFLIGLCLLMANDFVFKYEYGNFITGKLSDYVGLLIFPMFVAYLVPKLRRSISLIVGFAFFIWKTPLATPFIEQVNGLFSFSLYRTIDYTDYMALPILLLSHYLINNYEYKVWIPGMIRQKQFCTYSILVVAFFAFCATSVPRPFEMPQGTVYIGKSYNIKLSKDSIITTIKQLGYNCDYYESDSVRLRNGILPKSYYQTDNIVRYYRNGEILEVIDTIGNIKYTLTELNPKKTRLSIINVTISEDANLQDWQQLKVVSKQYEKWIKENLIEKID